MTRERNKQRWSGSEPQVKGESEFYHPPGPCICEHHIPIVLF
jgi:hypothetical protein